MTTIELQDWHAKRLGWEKIGSQWRRNGLVNPDLFIWSHNHPIPATLDEGDRLLREMGATWSRTGDMWFACFDQNGGTEIEEVPDTGDPVHDLLALAKAVAEAQQEKVK